MALDAAHRSSIYQKLVPLLGDDDANALMSEFPAIEADELVTKDFLRAELAVLRGELRDLGGGLRAEMAELGGDLRAEMAELGGDLRAEMAELGGGLRAEMAALETRLTTRLGAAIGVSTGFLAALGLFT